MKDVCNNYVGQAPEQKPKKYVRFHLLLSCRSRLSNQRNPMNDAESYTASCLNIVIKLGCRFSIVWQLLLLSLRSTDEAYNLLSKLSRTNSHVVPSFCKAYLPSNAAYKITNNTSGMAWSPDFVVLVLNCNCFNNRMG